VQKLSSKFALFKQQNVQTGIGGARPPTYYARRQNIVIGGNERIADLNSEDTNYNSRFGVSSQEDNTLE
jgi:hypothetical protein